MVPVLSTLSMLSSQGMNGHERTGWDSSMTDFHLDSVN
jgi:hypothetical protein